MDSINGMSGTGTAAVYAMEKAIKSQEQQMTKLLESAVPPAQNGSGAELTGLGQNLDIRA